MHESPNVNFVVLICTLLWLLEWIKGGEGARFGGLVEWVGVWNEEHIIYSSNLFALHMIGETVKAIDVYMSPTLGRNPRRGYLYSL